MTFLKSHWSQIRFTNPIERLNREVKRRINVAQNFPSEDALICRVGALLHERNDVWAVTRRYMSLETIAGLSDDATSVGTPAIAVALQSGQQWPRIMPLLLHHDRGRNQPSSRGT